MIIQCDQCERKFRVDDSKIKPPGSRVRCSKCGNVFFVEKKEVFRTEKDRGEDLRTEAQSTAAENQDDSLKLDFSAFETTVSSAVESNRQPEPDLTPQGNKDFVWTVNDIEAESRAENKEFTSVEPGLSYKEDIEISPTKDSGEQEAVSVSGSDSSTGFEWDSLKLDRESQRELPPTESVSMPQAVSIEEQLPFLSPSFKNDELPQNLQTEYRTVNEFSTPEFDDGNLKLKIKEEDSFDQTPPPKEAPPSDPFRSSLSVDQNALSQIKAESYGTVAPNMNDFSADPTVIKSRYIPKSKGFGSRLISLIVSLIAGLSILVIILSIFTIISINFNILPKEKTRELRQFLVSHLPVKVSDPLSNIKITDVKGKWLSTLNGPLYVLSGSITNHSGNIVNYIKIKSEFTNDGELLYDKSIYAGNTFTEQELQSLPLNDILVKLNRKNGDIDFSDPRKLAGKNYNIMPGESVEFYSVFPSDNQILGLKYNIIIEDAEVVEIEQTS